MRLSNKLLGQGYVKERLKSFLRKFFGRYGDLAKQYEVRLFRMFYDILEDDHIRWHPPWTRHYTNLWPFTDLNLITEFDFLPNCVEFPWNICNGCGMPTEDAYSSGHLVLSHFGTCMCSNVETNLSWTCLVSGLWVSIQVVPLAHLYGVTYLSRTKTQWCNVKDLLLQKLVVICAFMGLK